MDTNNAALDPEIQQLLLENARVHQQAVPVVAAPADGRCLEDGWVGKLEGAVLGPLFEVQGLLARVGPTLEFVVDDVRSAGLLSPPPGSQARFQAGLHGHQGVGLFLLFRRLRDPRTHFFFLGDRPLAGTRLLAHEIGLEGCSPRSSRPLLLPDREAGRQTLQARNPTSASPGETRHERPQAGPKACQHVCGEPPDEGGRTAESRKSGPRRGPRHR